MTHRREQDHPPAVLSQLAAIVDSSEDAILGKTLQGVITSWNRSAERLYGYTADDILGKSILLLVPPDHQDELPTILEQIRQGKSLQRYETVRVRKDGTPIEVSVSVSPIRDAEGRVVGASTIAHDITEQKRMAQELARRNHELEHMNGELLQQRNKLTVANLALEEANRIRGQFLSTMSHELRTPLASIVGFSEMLLEDAKVDGADEQQRINLERILKNSEHLLDLVTDVLDLAKIEAGRMVLDSSQVDVRELVSSVITEIESLAIARNLALRAEIEEGIGGLETNAAKLHQILLNLVSNALKFTEQGSVVLSATRVLLSDKQTPGIAFAVKDTGIGIPPEVQTHLFEAFYQADSTYTRKVGGTGLGLAIVDQFTALLGGTITLQSTSGEGSTFTVTLPIKAVHRDDQQMPPRLHSVQLRQVPTLFPSPEPRGSEQAPQFLAGPGPQGGVAGPHNIVLAVDDNPDTIVLIKTALKDMPYTVIGVEDPLTMMTRVQELHPCAITLDVMMPRLNGWQLLHQLKDNPATASIPVVMLTVLAEKTTGYVLGADEYVIKPFQKDVLCNTLERLIRARKG